MLKHVTMIAIQLQELQGR